MKALFTSWRTTLAGIALLAASITEFVNILSSQNPSTRTEWIMAIGLAIAGASSVFSRDNAVSSERAGAK